MRNVIKICRKWWVIGMATLIISPSMAWCDSGADRQLLRQRQPVILPQILVGSGLLYFPFYNQPLPIYPDIPGLYPCFPYGSCMMLQPLQKHERRKKHPKPEAVFKHGEPLTDEAMEAWRASLRQAAEPFRTDERQIVPTFREHSLIRSEYQQTGNVLPEFLTDEVEKTDADAAAENDQVDEGTQADE